jgi:hypothetical protein
MASDKDTERVIPVPLNLRQLFFDDYCLEALDGISRTMHQPAKKGAVIRPDVTKGETSFQIRSAPCWDAEAQVFRLLVGGKGKTVWESADGLHWRNIGSTEPILWTVIADPDESDPGRRYKAFTPTGGGNSQKVAAVSADMLHWQFLDIPSIQCSDEWNLSQDRRNHIFIATVKRGGPYGRSVFLTTSRDFEHWSEPELNFHADAEDQVIGREAIEKMIADERMQPKAWHPTDPGKYNVDVYNMGLFEYEGLYIGMPTFYHAIGPVRNYPNTYGFDIVQLVISRDLKTWDRLGRQAFIAPSPKNAGAYDITQVMPPSNAVIRGDALWFYYTGLKYRGEYDYFGTYPDSVGVPFHGTDPDSAAICLAVLRRDGFVSLDAGDAGGTVRTKPFAAEGTTLKINADAFGGQLSLKVLDRAGNVLAVSRALTEDRTDLAVSWEDSGFRLSVGQIVRLEFSLKNAGLYSFWLE